MAFHDTKKNNDYHSHNLILTCLGGGGSGHGVDAYYFCSRRQTNGYTTLYNATLFVQ